MATSWPEESAPLVVPPTTAVRTAKGADMRLFVQVLVADMLGSIALNGLASPGRLQAGADALSVATHRRGDI